MRHETKQRLLEGSTLSAGVLVAVALFAMVNYLAMRHYQRFDWTKTERYSLSEKSKSVVAGIDRDIDVVVALRPGSEVYTQVDELLARYEAANPRIRKRLVDAARDRLEAQRLVDRFGIDRPDIVVVASGDDRRVIDGFDLVEYDYSGAQLGDAPSIEAFTGEQRITSAILDLVENEKPEIRFVSGHGESTLDGTTGRPLQAVGELLGQDNFAVATWSSLGQEAPPEGADLLIVAGPRDRFLEPEVALFDRYLRAGGRMLLMIDPALDVTSRTFGDLGLTDWLAGYGVALRADFAVDPVQRLPLFGPETLFTDSYGSHPIVDSLAGRPVLMPLARSVTRADAVPEGFEVVELVRTSAEAWAETDLVNLEQAAPGGEDLTGPFALGVAVTFPAPPPTADASGGSAEADTAAVAEEADADDEAVADEAVSNQDDDQTRGRLVVLGDFDFATDEQIANGGNAELLLNTVNWLTERERLIAIEPRKTTSSQLLLGHGEMASLVWLILVLLPGAAVAAGIVVHFKRRR